MNENALLFRVYCVICDEHFCSVSNQKLAAIFNSLEDAAEWAEMKNSKAPNNCEYTVYGHSYRIDDPIMKGGQDDGTERN